MKSKGVKNVKTILNFILQNFGIEISPFLQNMISKSQSLNDLNNTALKQVVIEFAPIYQRHILDGPNWLAHFHMSLFCSVMNKPDLLKILEGNKNV